MSFANLGLAPEILQAVTDLGYTEPTPIQTQAIPVVLAGQDVMGGAQTGTGKTAGFTLPLLQRLLKHANTSVSPARHPLRALILAPTRELAVQVHESVVAYSKHLPLRSAVAYGGVDIKPQIAELRRGVEILVATPGRLLDHVEQKTVSFSQVEMLVLDEADRMLDMGFIPDIKRILNMLPERRQSLLFSATFSDEIKRLADSMLKAPVLIEVARRNQVNDTITHRVHPVSSFRKRDLLAHLVREDSKRQMLVFLGTKIGTGRLARELVRQGIAADAIHGDKTQIERMKALEAFKNGEIQVLVATDVAARGLDIEDLPYVVNYELPHVPEDYVHRIGRTGRAGKQGEAVSLVCADETFYLAEIEKLIKLGIEQVIVPGFEPESDWTYPPTGKRRQARRETFEEERGAGRSREGGRREREGREGAAGREGRSAAAPRRAAARSSMIAADGFDFSKPYESAEQVVELIEAAPAAAPEGQPTPHAAPRKPLPKKPAQPVAVLLGGAGR